MNYWSGNNIGEVYYPLPPLYAVLAPPKKHGKLMPKFVHTLKPVNCENLGIAPIIFR